MYTLLSYVLQCNAEAAKKMYTANLRLLFIEATTKEYAAGLDEHLHVIQWQFCFINNTIQNKRRTYTAYPFYACQLFK